MRRLIAALQVSVDGFIEGRHGEVDWVSEWSEDFDIRSEIDTCILGGGMYPGYEQYWMAILADPNGVLSLSGKRPTPGEVAYAHFADQTPHVVLSRTLAQVAWDTTRIVGDVDAIRAMKQEPGKAMYVVGGATLVSSLMNRDLIDEIRLVVHPLVLGGGTALFKDVIDRHPLALQRAESLDAGKLAITYCTLPTPADGR